MRLRSRGTSVVNHRTVTAALIYSRDFIAATHCTETDVLPSKCCLTAFAGSGDCNDHIRSWDALDRAHTKHPAMVHLHGLSPNGGERNAACWVESGKVPQVTFKPDWTRHAKVAPFKRNDAMLETMAIGVIAFPGSSITDNLADKARKQGIPAWRFGSPTA